MRSDSCDIVNENYFYSHSKVIEGDVCTYVHINMYILHVCKSAL